MIKNISFGIIPLYHCQEVLLVQNVNKKWGFPIGHKEGNESPIETALRELKEETGISDIRVEEDKIYKEETMEGNVKRIIYFYVGHVSSKEVISDYVENIDYQWIAFDQVDANISYLSTAKLFKSIFCN